MIIRMSVFISNLTRFGLTRQGAILGKQIQSIISLQSVDRTLKTSSPCQNKVYEMRQYVIKPDGVQEYKKLTQELFYLRTRASKLVGFWFTEIGSLLNKTVHLWEYDSLMHRQEVRDALANDSEWQNNYIANLVRLVQEQQNCTMYMPQWYSEVKSPEKQSGGVYELMTYNMVMGGPVIWGKKLKSSIEAHVRLGYADLIGVWYTDIGDHNSVEVLWRYNNLTCREEGRERAHNDAVVVNKVRDNLDNVTHHTSCLMLPSTWSPMQ
ncbi:unnamed protein product [Clavelina lepadiformis]|uniref:NIPSNAP domain-containing protein n=1 Tax=Clavelina lepadiformis TaxID=159417 RepID=A0ABP0G309_CLALP